MPADPNDKPDTQPMDDEFDALQEDSTRIIEKSKYLLGLTQTRIDHLKQELDQRRQESGETPAPSAEETERLLAEARERLANLKKRVERGKDRDRDSGRDLGRPTFPSSGF